MMLVASLRSESSTNMLILGLITTQVMVLLEHFIVFLIERKNNLDSNTRLDRSLGSFSFVDSEF